MCRCLKKNSLSMILHSTSESMPMVMVGGRILIISGQCLCILWKDTLTGYQGIASLYRRRVSSASLENWSGSMGSLLTPAMYSVQVFLITWRGIPVTSASNSGWSEKILRNKGPVIVVPLPSARSCRIGRSTISNAFWMQILLYGKNHMWDISNTNVLHL